MLLFRIFYIYLVSSLLILYFIMNINVLSKSSSGLLVLALFILLSTSVIVYDALKKTVFIKKSLLFLFLFMIYFLFKLILETEDMGLIKTLFISTTGGTIFFYILGLLLSLHLYYIKTNYLKLQNSLTGYNSLTFLFLFVVFIMLINSFFILYANIRTDIFLIDNIDGMYQRTGSFLTMLCLITSIFYIYSMVLNRKDKTFTNSLLSIGTLLLYFSILVISTVLSQLIGSNNAFICILGLLFAVITFKIFFLMNYKQIQLSNEYIYFNSIIYGKVVLKILFSIFTALFILLIMLGVFVYVMDIDLSVLRIFGFGKEDVGSADSRIMAWKNFPTQFNYSPIFGHFKVGEFTSDIAPSTHFQHVHSFVGTILTHLGLVGFLLFSLFVFSSFKEINVAPENKDLFFINSMLKIYIFLVFIGFFTVATYATFFSWIPLWFLLGLFFPSIVIKKENRI